MIFHENRLLDSHEISYLFFRKLGKMTQNLSSAAVVIGASRVNDHIDILSGARGFIIWPEQFATRLVQIRMKLTTID